MSSDAGDVNASVQPPADDVAPVADAPAAGADSPVADAPDADANNIDGNKKDGGGDAEMEPPPEKPRGRKIRASDFLDTIAEDENGDDDDDDDSGEDAYELDEGADDDLNEREEAAAHRRLDQRKMDRDAQETVAELEKRMKNELADNAGKAYRRRVDHAQVDIGALMPSLRDPNLYICRCDPGKEGEVIHAVLKRAAACRSFSTTKPLLIYSAYAVPMSKGYIYVEADRRLTAALTLRAHFIRSRVALFFAQCAHTIRTHAHRHSACRPCRVQCNRSRPRQVRAAERAKCETVVASPRSHSRDGRHHLGEEAAGRRQT
jgi:hypothetical protein